MNQQLDCNQYTKNLIKSISSLGMENPRPLIVALLAKLTMVRNSTELLNYSVILVNSRKGVKTDDVIYRQSVKSLARTLIPNFEELKKAETVLLDYLLNHKMPEISEATSSSNPTTRQRHNGWGGK